MRIIEQRSLNEHKQILFHTIPHTWSVRLNPLKLWLNRIMIHFSFKLFHRINILLLFFSLLGYEAHRSTQRTIEHREFKHTHTHMIHQQFIKTLINYNWHLNNIIWIGCAYCGTNPRSIQLLIANSSFASDFVTVSCPIELDFNFKLQLNAFRCVVLIFDLLYTLWLAYASLLSESPECRCRRHRHTSEFIRSFCCINIQIERLLLLFVQIYLNVLSTMMPTNSKNQSIFILVACHFRLQLSKSTKSSVKFYDFHMHQANWFCIFLIWFFVSIVEIVEQHHSFYT